MKTKTITLYEYSELSKESYTKAYETWSHMQDDPYMQSHMINLLKEELEDRGIEYDTDSIDVRYSLSYCQGDGFMFIGRITWNGYTVKIKHQGRYYHSYSKSVEMYKINDGQEIEPTEEDEKAFEEVYQAICKDMERKGYEHIEWITSEESFKEACEANEYTFREDGTMENE